MKDDTLEATECLVTCRNCNMDLSATVNFVTCLVRCDQDCACGDFEKDQQIGIDRAINRYRFQKYNGQPISRREETAQYTYRIYYTDRNFLIFSATGPDVRVGRDVSLGLASVDTSGQVRSCWSLNRSGFVDGLYSMVVGAHYERLIEIVRPFVIDNPTEEQLAAIRADLDPWKGSKK